MLFLRTIILTIVFFLVFNFSEIRSKKYQLQTRSFILPFSLSFALVLVDSFIKTAFHYAVLLFIIIAILCYFLLHLITKKG